MEFFCQRVLIFRLVPNTNKKEFLSPSLWKNKDLDPNFCILWNPGIFQNAKKLEEIFRGPLASRPHIVEEILAKE